MNPHQHTAILNAQNLYKDSKEQLDFEKKESLVFNDKNLTEFPKEILNYKSIRTH